MHDDSSLSSLLSGRLSDSSRQEGGGDYDVPRISLAAEQDDLWLNGGLRADGVHEFYAASKGDITAATGFALLMAHKRRQEDGRGIIWAREAGGLRSGGSAGQGGLAYGPGLAELGIDPDGVTLLVLPDIKVLLRAALDVARDGAIGVLVVEITGKCPLLGLTQSRRFALAAAASNISILFARGPVAEEIAPPSAAHTRWKIASAPSCAMAANAPGHPAFLLNLLRQRGGRDGLHIIMEWDRDTASFYARERDKNRIDTSGSGAAISGSSSAVDLGRKTGEQRPRAA